MTTKIWLPIVILAGMVAAGGAWYFSLSPLQLPATPSDAPVPDVAALSWKELRTGVDQMDALEVRQQGLLLFQSGDPDHAFLLFKRAANKGDGWSARAVGLMYDPATFAAGDFAPEKPPLANRIRARPCNGTRKPSSRVTEMPGRCVTGWSSTCGKLLPAATGKHRES